MRCPYCLSRKTKVIDKRDSSEMVTIRRRRKCVLCGARFTTFERAERVSLVIVKKDGKREEFKREKLRAGILKACAKRPVGMETIESLVDDIESELRRRDGLEVSHSVVGELVMEKLRALDPIAYIRFASVYRAFADVSSFEQEVQKLGER